MFIQGFNCIHYGIETPYWLGQTYVTSPFIVSIVELKPIVICIALEKLGFNCIHCGIKT